MGPWQSTPAAQRGKHISIAQFFHTPTNTNARLGLQGSFAEVLKSTVESPWLFTDHSCPCIRLGLGKNDAPVLASYYIPPTGVTNRNINLPFSMLSYMLPRHN